MHDFSGARLDEKFITAGDAKDGYDGGFTPTAQCRAISCAGE